MFLSKHLIANAPTDKLLVVSGGFKREDEVQTSGHELNIEQLVANHEEADTRLVLHCLHANTQSIFVSAQNTNVLVLLLAHFDKITCTKLWMKAGIAKRHKYIAVLEIHEKLPVTPTSHITFHALTGCDTVSHFAGHSKRMAWKVFLTDNCLKKTLAQGN